MDHEKSAPVGNFNCFIKFRNKRTKGGFYSYDDTGMAQRIVDSYQGKFMYVTTENAFYYWNNSVWKIDGSLVIKQCFNAVMDKLSLEPPHIDEGINMSGKDEAELRMKIVEARDRFISKERSHSGKKNAIEEIKPLIPVESEMLNADETLINTPAGVLKTDFKSRKIDLWPHIPDFLLTKMTKGRTGNYPYRGSRWEQFLNEVFLGDLETIEFVQQAVGYSLIGLGKNQLMFILFGDDTDDRKNGSNGKSVFLNAISNALGDYAWKMNPDSIIAGKKIGSGSNATPDIVALKGKRFVTTSELENGAKLNEARIKSLISGEKQNARALYQSNINFTPTFTIWLSTNYKPKLTGTDSGIWRRLVYIPFLAKFSENTNPKIDMDLPAKLDEEQDVIFQWIIDGAQKYLSNEENKLSIPKRISEINENQRKMQDIVKWFMDDCVELTDDQGDHLENAVIREKYNAWSKANKRTISYEKFAQLLYAKFKNNYRRSSKSRFYFGMKLINN